MNDLIEKIHELKDYENYDYDQAITDVEILLNQHNIITAPKSIKLSEVLCRLEDIKEYYHISSIVYDKEFRGLLDSEDYYPPIVKFNKDLSFKVINLPINDNTKWLYTLWIAGTEIIDDLEEKEHEED